MILHCTLYDVVLPISYFSLLIIFEHIYGMDHSIRFCYFDYIYSIILYHICHFLSMLRMAFYQIGTHLLCFWYFSNNKFRIREKRKMTASPKKKINFEPSGFKVSMQKRRFRLTSCVIYAIIIVHIGNYILVC